MKTASTTELYKGIRKSWSDYGFQKSGNTEIVADKKKKKGGFNSKRQSKHRGLREESSY